MTGSSPGRRRVVVTGVGVCSPLGNGPGAVLESLRTGRSGLRPVEWTLGDERLATAAGLAELPEEAVDARSRRRLDRFTLLALAAAAAAVEDTRGLGDEGSRRETGVFLGVGFGGIETFVAQSERLAQRGPRRVSPLFVPATIANIAAGQIAEKHGLRGPNLTYANACAAGATAIGEAWRQVRDGSLDLALAGGAEAAVVPLAAAGFASMRALADPEAGCRPFDRERTGFLLGEGATVLVLEEYERALARQSTIYGEILGYGASADAHHLTEPDPAGTGAELAVRRALAEGGVTPARIDYVNAHATGTPVGDRAEAEMLRRMLGEAAAETWVSSTKGLTGHLLGAAGALEAAVTLLALQSGLLPPNLPCDAPEAGLRLVREAGIQEPLEVALSTSFGFGGVNAALLFGAPDLGVDGRRVKS